jgi:hypothetical protein
MLVLNGFFKDNTVVPERPVYVPDGTRVSISFEDSPAGRNQSRIPPEYLEEDLSEQAFKCGLDPQEQLKALKKFHEDLDRIKDEPLDEVFDRAVNAGLKFTQVDF